MAEARRLGGLRRRREVAVSGAFDFVGLQNVPDIRRLLEVAMLDTLESAVQGKQVLPESVFDVEPVDSESTVEVESSSPLNGGSRTWRPASRRNKPSSCGCKRLTPSTQLRSMPVT